MLGALLGARVGAREGRDVLGALLGACVGALLGALLGASVGAREGRDVLGALLGASVGALDGAWLGAWLGARVGVCVGLTEGLLVVGAWLGAREGVRLGEWLGVNVAMGVPSMHTQSTWWRLEHSAWPEATHAVFTRSALPRNPCTHMSCELTLQLTQLSTTWPLALIPDHHDPSTAPAPNSAECRAWVKSALQFEATGTP